MANHYCYKHIVVVHGIGDQAPNETGLGFMNELIRALPRDKGMEPIVYNLVSTVDDITMPSSVPKPVSPSDPGPRTFEPAYIEFADRRNPNDSKLYVIGFSEVYWQPITNHYLRENDQNLPIPILTWAETIAMRLLGPGYDLAQWRAAIENLETLLKLVEKLAAISKKSEVFVRVTKQFLGDVQMYAESDEIRQRINAEFFRVMGRIPDALERTKQSLRARVQHRDSRARDFADFEGFESHHIYVVAHSEGTVVAYNSLIQAAMIADGSATAGDPELGRAKAAEDEARADTHRGVSDWLPGVAGLVTLGSPLDKHHLIWRNRFRKDFLAGHARDPEHRIPLFNFADRSDPVAYGLDAVQMRDEKNVPTDAQCLFRIEDKAFQRYPIPGKAHVDYWTDPGIFDHIVRRVMGLVEGTPEPLSDGWWAPLQSIVDRVAYVVGRMATFALALFFLCRLLSSPTLDGVRCFWLFATAYHLISTSPFAVGAIWLNRAVWLFSPLLVMKLLVEAEQGRFKLKLGRPVRLAATAVWFAVAFVFCLSVSGGGEATTMQDLLGYGTGLVATILAWKLHTAVHRGLIQLWRYTKVL